MTTLRSGTEVSFKNRRLARRHPVRESSRPTVGQDSDGEDERNLRRAVSSIKERGKKYKRLFDRAQKEASDLGQESAECSIELGERVEMLEERFKICNAAKERTQSHSGFTRIISGGLVRL